MDKNTYRTGCFTLLNIGKEEVISENKTFNNYCLRKKGFCNLCTFVARAVHDGLAIIKKSSDVEALASSVPDNGGV